MHLEATSTATHAAAPASPAALATCPTSGPTQTSRAGLSKIVSEAAHFNDTPTGQQFQDVPPGSTFYAYIYRLVVRQILSGYPCGNPEPCVPPDDLPYFRTGNPATRGQTAKIVSNTFFPECQPPAKP